MENGIKVERGQVYNVRFDNGVGHEMGTFRPVLVVSNQYELDRGEVAIVLMMTTAKYNNCKAVKVNFAGKIQYILCEQIRTLDKSRLTQYMGKIDDKDLVRVRGALLYVLSLAGVANGVAASEKAMLDENVEDKPESVDEIRARVESELYQRLYTKAMADLVEARYKLDELQLKYDRECKTPIIEVAEPVVKRETVVDVDALKRRMTTPNDEMRFDDPPLVTEVEVAEPVDRDEDIPEILGKSSGGNKKTLTVKEIEKILIRNGYVISDAGSGRMKVAKGAKPINVNTAKPKDLMALGMGQNVAYAITKHRKLNGNFESFEDLLLVDRFGQNVARIFGPYLEI